MKSSQNELEKRGFATEEDIRKIGQESQLELLKLIHSDNQVIRTSAVYNLYILNSENVKELLKQLLIEKCLYTKIAICERLEKGDSATTKQMIVYLGEIGNNQHKKLPDRVSAKKSFPLPRDIIARSLEKMDLNIFPVIIEVLHSEEIKQISEVLDAIGFMVFYNSKLASEKNANEIYEIIEKYKNNDLIVWKSIIYLSAFPLPKTLELLESFVNDENILGEEARRSIRIINRRLR